MQTFENFNQVLTHNHILIAGCTGSGKSVVINNLIYHTLFQNNTHWILIDPKRVELSDWKNFPHCIGYSDSPETAIQALEHALNIIENRYTIMQREHVKKWTKGRVYIIIDELADLLTSNEKRKALLLLQRIAQVGRAASVYIIGATQTLNSKVLSTTLTCNFDTIIGLKTRTQIESRMIIGKSGLETLPNYGKAVFVHGSNETIYNVPLFPEWLMNECKQRFNVRY